MDKGSVQAGTPISKDNPVYHNPPAYAKDKRRQINGYIDRQARIFQGGGERAAMLYGDPPMLTFHEDVWRAIIAPHNALVTIEMIDKGRNEVLAVDVETARTTAKRYQTSSGPRWGVPMTFVTIKDATGAVIKAPGQAPRQAKFAFEDMDPADYRKPGARGSGRGRR